MSDELNRRFLEIALVWPNSQDPGWINLHTHLKNNDPQKNGGRPFVIGWPYKTIDELISRASWIDTTDTMFDVWYCTSQQRECTQGKTAKATAVRLARNAAWLKSIWFDIDVKAKSSDWGTTTRESLGRTMRRSRTRLLP